MTSDKTFQSLYIKLTSGSCYPGYHLSNVRTDFLENVTLITGGHMNRDRKRHLHDRKQPTVSRVEPKRIWHPMSLQQLHQDRFIDVVNGILNGRNDIFQGSLADATVSMDRSRLSLQLGSNLRSRGQ